VIHAGYEPLSLDAFVVVAHDVEGKVGDDFDDPASVTPAARASSMSAGATASRLVAMACDSFRMASMSVFEFVRAA
jgi:hypothetical protein